MVKKTVARSIRTAMGSAENEGLLQRDRPEFAISSLYTVSILSVAALIIVMASGAVLALRGADWYHSSQIGLFFNSIHFWSTEFFFLLVIVHIWANFWKSAWREGRFSTWVAGMILFLIAIATAFTGFLVQTNFHSQVMAFQSKDSLNAVGIGQLFNTLNTGQMLLLHVSILPVALGAGFFMHLVMVRRNGLVPPPEAEHNAGTPQ
ncbi:MAG TPA: cytochrome b N-terminal domain-containing protein [archaeon]|nr:cytochrome b N-terminal domain-containing protein [archaeon]